MKRERVLLYFGTNRLDDMIKKGNVWYIHHYEAYFDRVYTAYLLGDPHPPVTEGQTTLLSLGTGRGKLDVLMAPLRLFRLAGRINPTVYLSADLVLSWWTTILARLLKRARYYLVPVCMPHSVYRTTRGTLLDLPELVEKTFTRLCFHTAHRVLTGKGIQVFIDWLSSLPYIRRKLLIVDVIVDELPPPEFYRSLAEYKGPPAKGSETRLLFVGRLNREKRVDHLIRVLDILRARGIEARLQLLGDGPERGVLEKLSRRLGLMNKVDFLGFKKSGELVRYYKEADIFLSTLTGTALREAALCQTAAVVYNNDWVSGLLTHEENALLVKEGSIEEMAKQVARLVSDEGLKERISKNFHELAMQMWNLDILVRSLEETFGVKC